MAGLRDGVDVLVRDNLSIGSYDCEAAIEFLERSGKSADDLDDYAADVRDDFYHSERSIAKLRRAAQRPMGDGGLVMG